MKLPFPQKDGVSVLVDTYSDNDVPLAISQVEIIIRGSDVVIRTQDGSELTLVQAAQMSSMHENLFNLNFADGTVVSSNELFQRADLIEPGPELSEIRENNIKSDANADPLVAVVQSAPVSETTDLDSDDVTGGQGGGKGDSDEHLSVADFLGNPPSVEDTISFVPSTSAGGGTPPSTNTPSEAMPAPVMPASPSEPSTPTTPGNPDHGSDHNGGNNDNNNDHNGGNNDNNNDHTGGDGDNTGNAGLAFVEQANLYQVTNTKTVVDNGDGTQSTVWHLGGGSPAARTNPDLGVQYGEPAILDLRNEADQEKGFTVHADNEAFKYGQVNTENSPNNLDRRLGRIVTFDQLVGGESVAGKTIKNITGIPDGMTIIWKGGPGYDDFVAKYGIELKDNEIFVNYKGNVDYNGNNINITWVDAQGRITKAKSEFTNQYNGDHPDTVINGNHAIVLPKTPNAREIYGGSGNDTIYASQFNNNIKYDGEGGTNRLIFGDDYPITTEEGSNALPGLVYDVANNKITDTGNGDVAEMHNFTEIVGTKGDDHFLIGDTATSYYFDGRDGNNVFDMQMTDPQDSTIIKGSSGNNQLFAGSGEDTYNLVNSSGNNTVVDRGKGDSNDTYNFESSTGQNKVTDAGGSDFYHFDKATNRVEINDSAAGNDQYQFHNIKDNQVTINDRNDGDSLSGSDIYDFATLTAENSNADDHIENSIVTILDENGSDKYQFDRTKGGSVTIDDEGKISAKDVAKDEYHFSGAETKVDITDKDGADKYSFENAKTSADNTITVKDYGTANDIYNFNDVTSESRAEGTASNVSILDKGGKDEYHFDRLQSKVRIDDIGSGDNYFTFHNADKSDITINNLNDGIYLGGNDIYDFATLKENNQSAEDHINDTTVAIADEYGNDLYSFDRTTGGSVTIKDTGVGNSNDRTVAADQYHFSKINTKVDITDQDGSDSYDFSDSTTSAENTIKITDNSNNYYTDTYNFNNTQASSFATGAAANIVISDTGGTDHYYFNKITSKVNIDDYGSGQDDYRFHEAKDSNITIYDHFSNRGTSQNLDNVYDFATHNTSSGGQNPTDFISNTIVNITDESGADKYYFDRTQGGSVTIVDYAISNSGSNDRDQYFFDDSYSKVSITDGGASDNYNFNRILVDQDNTVTIKDQGGTNSGDDVYNFNDVKAKSDAVAGGSHIYISDDYGSDHYNFNNFGDATSSVISSVKIDDSGRWADNYSFHNAVNAKVNIHDYGANDADDSYDFAGNGNSDTDHISNVTVNIQDDTGQDRYYFNRTDASTISIIDGDDWQDNYFFNDTNNSNITIRDGGGVKGGSGGDNYNFDRTQGGSVKITEGDGTSNYNFHNVKTKVNIEDGGGWDNYNFQNSTNSDVNTITIVDGTGKDTYNFQNTTSENFAADNLYNITITDGLGADIYDFTGSKTKVSIEDTNTKGDEKDDGSDTYIFNKIHDSIVKIKDTAAHTENGNNTYNFGVDEDTKIVNSEVDITDKGGDNKFYFKYGQGGDVNITTTTDEGGDDGSDNYRFDNSNFDTVKIEDSYFGDSYYFINSTTKNVTILDHGSNESRKYRFTDHYHFNDSAIAQTKIVDDQGSSDYNFTNSGTADSIVKISDGGSTDTYNFEHAKGDVTIFDGGGNEGYSNFDRIVYDSEGHMDYYRDKNGNYTDENGKLLKFGSQPIVKHQTFGAQNPDDFDFKYSSASKTITDGIVNDADSSASGLNKDNGNSAGAYHLQYSTGRTVINNRGGYDKYYLGGSTGETIINGGTGTDIVYVGKGYLVYDGGTRTDGGKENDWISFQDVLESTDANGNTVANKIDPNGRTEEEGVYINLGANELGYADNNEHNILSHDEHGAVLADGADKGHVSNVENVIGSKFNDLIYGNDKDNYFVATQGHDIYYGGAGSDTYFVGAPNLGGRVDGLLPDDERDLYQLDPWAAKPDIGIQNDVTINLDTGEATTLWKDKNGKQYTNELHDFENAYGAYFFNNKIIGRWGTDGTLVGGYKGDQIYSVENSSKDGISYIDGNDLSTASNDTLYYNYVSNGRFINGVYVKMDDGQSYSGTTVKGFYGYDENHVAQGTQGHDVFKRIGTITGTQGNDVFEGSSAGGHKFNGGGGGDDLFISHGGVGSEYTHGVVDYSHLDPNEFFVYKLSGEYNGQLVRDRNPSYEDRLNNVTGIIGSSGDDSVLFTTHPTNDNTNLIAFDGGDGTDYMLKRIESTNSHPGSIYNISGGIKNVEGIGFIDNYKDTVNLDMDKFFKDFMTGKADADGHYHAHFFVDGQDEFNAFSSGTGDWQWKLTSDNGNGDRQWTAFEKDSDGNYTHDTGNTIDVTKGTVGDSHPQDRG